MPKDRTKLELLRYLTLTLDFIETAVDSDENYEFPEWFYPASALEEDVRREIERQEQHDVPRRED